MLSRACSTYIHHLNSDFTGSLTPHTATVASESEFQLRFRPSESTPVAFDMNAIITLGVKTGLFHYQCLTSIYGDSDIKDSCTSNL